jgi:hypothetical protein
VRKRLIVFTLSEPTNRKQLAGLVLAFLLYADGTWRARSRFLRMESRGLMNVSVPCSNTVDIWTPTPVLEVLATDDVAALCEKEPCHDAVLRVDPI